VLVKQSRGWRFRLRSQHSSADPLPARVVTARERTIYEPMLRTLGAADGGGGGVG